MTQFSVVTALALSLLLVSWSAAWGADQEGAVNGKAPFEVEVAGRTLPYTMNFEPVMPAQDVVFTVHRSLAPRVTVRVNDKPLARQNNRFVWRAADKAGLHSAAITLEPTNNAAAGATITVQLFVTVPAKQVKNGVLNGYRIGQYPSPLRNLTAYRAPASFIEVTPELVDTPISPNFTLGQFLCKQASGFPKYMVLQPALLTKLEELLLEVNEQGIKTSSFVVMSGYRTPFYNQVIKNVPSSYHIYGGAADIYIDVNPQDGVMDDLNGDGKQDRKDAAYLYKLADSFVIRHNRPELVGGVGEYGANWAHGPFVHIDVRGLRARWGHPN